MTSSNDSDSTPFLHEEKSDFEDDASRTTRRHWPWILIHVIIATIYTSVITFAVFGFARFQRAGILIEGQYTPAQEAVAYKTWQLDPANFSGNPFVGDPRPEHDAAWNGLMQNIHLRITPEEYTHIRPQINRDTAKLAGGEGYVVGLGVYHELHCLKWIRHWIHRDVYWPDLVGAALEERKWHIEHCLELFRLNTMCDASLAVSTFDWLSVDPPRLTPHQHGMYERKCMDWEKLDAWSTERRIDIFEPGVLDPPKELPKVTS